MKLKQLRIKNLRGLKGDTNIISFDDNDINFLIGPNNVGKSTYLEAYDFFSNTKTTFSIDDFTSHSAGITREIEAWFVISKYSSAVKSSCDYSNGELYWFNKWADNDTLKIMKVCHINKPRVKTYYIKNKLKNLITYQYFMNT